MSSAINYFHIFAVAPALAYLLNENRQGRVISSDAATAGLVVVLVVVLYHAYLAYQKMSPAVAANTSTSPSPAGVPVTAPPGAVTSDEFLAKGAGKELEARVPDVPTSGRQY